MLSTNVSAPWLIFWGASDKYVTRQEYEALRADHDQLKRKFNQLEMVVSRMLPTAPAGTRGMPMYSISQDVSGQSADNPASYHVGPQSHVLYPPSAVPSSVSHHLETVPRHPPYPTTSPYMMPEGAPQTSVSATQSALGSSSTGHIRRPSDGKSPTQVRASALSLASITTPYNLEVQSKNCHAQMLKLLGECLRLAQGGWKGPAVFPCTRQRRARRMLPWKVPRHLPWDYICPVPRREGGSEIPLAPTRQ